MVPRKTYTVVNWDKYCIFTGSLQNFFFSNLTINSFSTKVLTETRNWLYSNKLICTNFKLYAPGFTVKLVCPWYYLLRMNKTILDDDIFSNTIPKLQRQKFPQSCIIEFWLQIWDWKWCNEGLERSTLI